MVSSVTRKLTVGKGKDYFAELARRDAEQSGAVDIADEIAERVGEERFARHHKELMRIATRAVEVIERFAQELTAA